MANKKILIVEDDKDICEILIDYLTKIFEKIDVNCCNDGTTALHNINFNHYDYMFFDLSIPTIDGMDLIKAARIKILMENGAPSSLKSTPIIFVISGKPVHNCKVGCCSKPWHEWLDVAARIIYPVSFIAFASFYGIYVYFSRFLSR